MKERNRDISINEQEEEKESSEENSIFQISQNEIAYSCLIDLSMEDYALLAQRAMREGCSPEELVARQIARLVK